jgi:hypothetical protein
MDEYDSEMPERLLGESGPNYLARVSVIAIARMSAERAAMPPSERARINEKLRSSRRLLRFAKTQAGYVAPSGGVNLQICAIKS